MASNVNCKISFGDVKRKLVVQGGCPPWSDFISLVKERFGLSEEDVRLEYIDEDGDEVTMSSDVELKEAWPIEQEGRKPTLYLQLKLVSPGSTRQSSATVQEEKLSEVDDFEMVDEVEERYPVVDAVVEEPASEHETDSQPGLLPKVFVDPLEPAMDVDVDPLVEAKDSTTQVEEAQQQTEAAPISDTVFIPIESGSTPASPSIPLKVDEKVVEHEDPPIVPLPPAQPAAPVHTDVQAEASTSRFPGSFSDDPPSPSTPTAHLANALTSVFHDPAIRESVGQFLDKTATLARSASAEGSARFDIMKRELEAYLRRLGVQRDGRDGNLDDYVKPILEAFFKAMQAVGREGREAWNWGEEQFNQRRKSMLEAFQEKRNQIKSEQQIDGAWVQEQTGFALILVNLQDMGFQTEQDVVKDVAVAQYWKAHVGGYEGAVEQITENIVADLLG